jgi:hypothetical protein
VLLPSRFNHNADTLTKSGLTGPGASWGQQERNGALVEKTAGAFVQPAQNQAAAGAQRDMQAAAVAQASAFNSQMRGPQWAAGQLVQGSGQEPNLHAKRLVEEHKIAIMAALRQKNPGFGGNLERLGQMVG